MTHSTMSHQRLPDGRYLIRNWCGKDNYTVDALDWSTPSPKVTCPECAETDRRLLTEDTP